jgi:hypothetical protein
VIGDVFVVVCLRRFVVVEALGRSFAVEGSAVVYTFREQEREGLVVNIILLVAFGSGFVSGIVNTVEELVGVLFVVDSMLHFLLLAELLQKDLFRMNCLLLEGSFLCLFLVESLLGWLHLEVVLLVGWSLMVHLAELLLADLLRMDCLLSEGSFLCWVESLLGWLHLEVVLLVGRSLVVHLYLLAELLQKDLFGMDCLLSEGLFSCLFLVDSLLGWLHLEVVLLMGWLLVVHLAELLQDDLFRMDCLLSEVLFLSVFGWGIVGLVAFGDVFVDGMVVGGAFGRAAAGGLVWDGLFVVGMFVLVSVFGWVIVGLVAVAGDFVGGMVFVVSCIYIFGWFVVVVDAFGRILVWGCVVVVAAVWWWHPIRLRVIVLCNGLFSWHCKAKTADLGSWCNSIWRTMILALAIMFLIHMGHFWACGGAMVLGRMGQQR